MKTLFLIAGAIIIGLLLRTLIGMAVVIYAALMRVAV